MTLYASRVMPISLLGPAERERVRHRFRLLAEWLAEDERDLRHAAAQQDPGERLALGLRLCDAALADYRSLLGDAAFARAEDERALGKAGLHEVWRTWRR